MDRLPVELTGITNVEAHIREVPYTLIVQRARTLILVIAPTHTVLLLLVWRFRALYNPYITPIYPIIL